MNENTRNRQRQRPERDKAEAAHVDSSSEKQAENHDSETVEKNENQPLVEQNARDAVEPKRQNLTPTYGDTGSKKSTSHSTPVQPEQKAKSQNQVQKVRTKSPDPIANLLFNKPSLEPKTGEKPLVGPDSRNQIEPEYKPKKISDSQAKKIAAQNAREHKQRSLVKALFDRDCSYLDHVNRSLEPQRDAPEKSIDRGVKDSPERDKLADLIKPQAEVPTHDLEKSSRLPEKNISLDKAPTGIEQPPLAIERPSTQPSDAVVHSKSEPISASHRAMSDDVETKIRLADDSDEIHEIEKESEGEETNAARDIKNRFRTAAVDVDTDIKSTGSVGREITENLDQKQPQNRSIADQKNELEQLQSKTKLPSRTNIVVPQVVVPPTALAKGAKEHPVLRPGRQNLAPERLSKPEEAKEKSVRTPLVKPPENVPSARPSTIVDRDAIRKQPSERTKSLIKAYVHKDAHTVIEPVLKAHPQLKQLIDRATPGKDSLIVKAIHDQKLERQVDAFMHKYENEISKAERSKVPTESTEKTDAKPNPDLVIELPAAVVRQVMTMKELEPETIAFLREQFSQVDRNRSNPEPKPQDKVSIEPMIFDKLARPSTPAREFRAREQIKQLLDANETQLTAREEEKEILIYAKRDRQMDSALTIEQSLRTVPQDAIQGIIGVDNFDSIVRGKPARTPAKQNTEDNIHSAVVKQEQEIERLRDEEPAPVLFCTLRLLGNWDIGLRIWQAKTIEEFDCNDPDIPASASAIKAIVDIDRRWKLWRSRFDRELAQRNSKDYLSPPDRDAEYYHGSDGSR